MSNKQNILFRADSSSSIGTGHIMRDLVLAKQYSNSKIIFATQNLHGNINYKIEQEGYLIKILKTNTIEELNILIKKYKIDLIIFDHYDINYGFEKQLKIQNLSLKILSFDDTYEKHYCDILLNHNISANKDNYKKLVPKFCEIRCGSEYTLLRKEFYDEKKIKQEIFYDIFIAMGGADTANININILKTLPKNLKVVIVTTNANKNLIKLKNYIKNKKNISLFINSNKIANLIKKSKLAIITPSVTVNEVLFLEVKFIAIKTENNQKDVYNYLLSKGYDVLDKFDSKIFLQLLKKLLGNSNE